MKKEQFIRLLEQTRKSILRIWTLPRLLTAFVLTVVIMYYASVKRPRDEEKEIQQISVPVKYYIPKNYIDLSINKEPQVTITVKAAKNVMKKLKDVFIEIKTPDSGINVIQTKDLIFKDPLLKQKIQIIEFKPSSIQLDFDTVEKKQVRINLKYNEGVLPKGYELLNKAELDKYMIEISGARRDVDLIKDGVSSMWIKLDDVKLGKNTIKVQPYTETRVTFSKKSVDVDFMIGEKNLIWNITNVPAHIAPPDNAFFRNSVPDNVTIKLKGPELLVDKWSPADFKLDVKVPESAVNSQSLELTPDMVTFVQKEKEGKDKLEIIEVDPKTIKFELDTMTSASIPVKPVVGKIPEGYVLDGELKSKEAKIVVKGPARLLNGIKEIQTEPVELSNTSGSRTTFPAKIIRPSGLTLPENVQIEYSLKLEMTKTPRVFSHIPVNFELRNGIVFQSSEPPEKFVSVAISGPSILVDKIREQDIKITKKIEKSDAFRYAVGSEDVDIVVPEELKQYKSQIKVKIERPDLSLQLDQYITRELPIVPVYSTKKLPAGYHADVRLTQQSIKVSGPGRFLKNVKEIQTEEIPVETLKSGEEKALLVSLIKPNGIKQLEPSEVRVNVKVSGLKTELLKNVDIPVLLNASAAEKNQTYNISPSKADIEVEYPPVGFTLDRTKLHIYVAPSRDVPGIYDCNVIYWFDQPDVKIKSITPASVKLEIKASPKNEINPVPPQSKVPVAENASVVPVIVPTKSNL